MDGAQASHLYLAVETSAKFQRVEGHEDCDKASGADLGGSSKYSNENFED